MSKVIGQDYIDVGYKKFDNKINELLKHTRILYQKRVSDYIGTRYFIDVWDYGQNGFQTEVGLYNHDEDLELNITLMIDGDITDNEIYIDGLWKTLNMGYYEVNDNE